MSGVGDCGIVGGGAVEIGGAVYGGVRWVRMEI